MAASVAQIGRHAPGLPVNDRVDRVSAVATTMPTPIAAVVAPIANARRSGGKTLAAMIGAGIHDAAPPTPPSAIPTRRSGTVFTVAKTNMPVVARATPICMMRWAGNRVEAMLVRIVPRRYPARLMVPSQPARP